jgi:hypothetical protein
VHRTGRLTLTSFPRGDPQVVEIAQDAYAIIERIVQNLDRMPQY